MLCASCGAFEKRLYPDPFETDTSLIRAIYILHTWYILGYPFFAVGMLAAPH